jgi:branched-chain amino acid transport system substrate-binding protein
MSKRNPWRLFCFFVLFIVFNLSIFPLAGTVIAETLKIGYIGGLTGDSAIIGNEILKSLQTSISEINKAGGIDGDKLELVVEDDGYVVSRAITAYEKLKSQVNSRIIFMNTFGAVLALGKRPAKDQVLLVDTLDCNDAIVKTSAMHTCVATRTESIAEAFLQQIAAQGGGRVAVLYEEEAWFNFIVAILRKGLGANLIEINAPVAAADYRAEVLKLKSSGVKHIVFLGGDSMGRAFAEARRTGVNSKFYSIAGVTSPGFVELAGDSLEGTFVSNWLIPRGPLHAEFSEHFRQQHGAQIVLDFVVGPTHDAVQLLSKALKKSRDPLTIRKLLPAEPAFDGISGKIKMDPDGAVRSIREQIYIYQQGQLLPISGD